MIVDPELGQPGAHFLHTAPVQRTQDDAFPICAHFEVFHSAETGNYRLWESDLVLDCSLREHDNLIKGNKEILPPNGLYCLA